MQNKSLLWPFCEVAADTGAVRLAVQAGSARAVAKTALLTHLRHSTLRKSDHELFDRRNGAHPSDDSVEILLSQLAEIALPGHRQLEHAAVAAVALGQRALELRRHTERRVQRKSESSPGSAVLMGVLLSYSSRAASPCVNWFTSGQMFLVACWPIASVDAAQPYVGSQGQTRSLQLSFQIDACDPKRPS